MVKMTKEMVNQLRSGHEQNFIDSVVTHCYRHYSYLSSTIEVDDLRDVVREGIKQANRFGYNERGSVTFYIELMVVFGVGMSTDPQYDWLQALLHQGQGIEPQLLRARAVQKQVHAYLDEISGLQSEHLEGAAQVLSQLSVATLTIGRETIVEDVSALLARIYPQKVARTSESGLFALIQQGYEKARHAYGVTQPNHYALIIVLMFLLGHEFDRDKIYGWAHPRGLEVEGGMSYEQGRAMEALERKARLWLEGALLNERRERQQKGE